MKVITVAEEAYATECPLANPANAEKLHKPIQTFNNGKEIVRVDLEKLKQMVSHNSNC